MNSKLEKTAKLVRYLDERGITVDMLLDARDETHTSESPEARWSTTSVEERTAARVEAARLLRWLYGEQEGT